MTEDCQCLITGPELAHSAHFASPNISGILAMARPTAVLVLLLPLLLSTVQCQVKRSYNFTITNIWFAGDGHGRPVFAINGQTPGPLIEADEGDEIEVFLDNQLTFETTMHW
jgi:FtsP/CotA-like multicopper oxidase with cupredoxin domain